MSVSVRIAVRVQGFGCTRARPLMCESYALYLVNRKSTGKDDRASENLAIKRDVPVGGMQRMEWQETAEMN